MLGLAGALALGVAVGRTAPAGEDVGAAPRATEPTVTAASTSPAAVVIEWPLRISERAGPPETVTAGRMLVRVLGWRCGMLAVRGDHADWLADGQYCRVRLRLASADRYLVVYDAADQSLLGADAERVAAELDAVQISDQPTHTEVRPGTALELDVWFDAPTDFVPTAVEVVAEGVAARIPLG